MDSTDTQNVELPAGARSLDQVVVRWDKTTEVRLNPDGTIDEIVMSDVANLHLEQMDDGCWWLGIARADGEMLRVNLYTKRNAAIAVNAESDDGIICEGFPKASNAAIEKAWANFDAVKGKPADK